MTHITVAFIDDHELVREGLAAWLMAQAVSVVVLASTCSVATLRAGPGWGTQVVLLDTNLRDETTVEENVLTLRSAGSAVVVVSMDACVSTVRRALSCGAAGYVLKSGPGRYLVQAVLAVHRGEVFLTPELSMVEISGPGRPRLSAQELRALRLYATGLPLKSVALRMGISPGSAKTYLDRIRSKYGDCGRPATTKIDLYRRAVEDGLIPAI